MSIGNRYKEVHDMLRVVKRRMSSMLHSPAFEKNIGPVTAALGKLLDAHAQSSPVVVEVGSGPGAHIAHWAARFDATFFPTEQDDAQRASCAAYAKAAGLTNVYPAQKLVLDAGSEASIAEPIHADVIATVNVVHMVSLPVVGAFFRFAQRLARPGTQVFVYDTFQYAGMTLPESNIRFDAWLKRVTDGAGGVHDFDDVNALAQRAGFATKTPARVDHVPANNQVVTWTYDADEPIRP